MLTCGPISHCTEGNKGIKCVLPQPDRSPALRSPLVYLCLFEVVNTAGSFADYLSKIVSFYFAVMPSEVAKAVS